MRPSYISPQIKICGLTRAQDVAYAVRSGADYLGFIVEAKSARKLSVTKAAHLAEPYISQIPRVAVTVNAPHDILRAIIAEMKPDFIQFHGDESPEHIAEIAKTFAVKTIKAVPISSPSDMVMAETYAGVADIILYDAKPASGEARGGHGRVFDWDILTTAPRPKLWALAGGLTPENVRDACHRTQAPILDVSSGVETSAGVKDPQMIDAFIKAARTE